jgi:hypothetical protein
MIDYTYYKIEFEVVWKDGSKERIEHEQRNESDGIAQRRGGVRIMEFNGTYMFKRWPWSTPDVRGEFKTVRELNFDYIKEINKLDSEMKLVSESTK